MPTSTSFLGRLYLLLCLAILVCSNHRVGSSTAASAISTTTHGHAVGEWNVTLHPTRKSSSLDDMFLFQEPQEKLVDSKQPQTGDIIEQLPTPERPMESTTSGEARVAPFWSRQRRQQRRRSSSLDCQLSLCDDGTFWLRSRKEQTDTSSIRGRWTVLPNPYCLTDRFYDQLQLVSYARARTIPSRAATCTSEDSTTNDDKTLTSTLSKGPSDMKKGMSPCTSTSMARLELYCRMKGRFYQKRGQGRRQRDSAPIGDDTDETTEAADSSMTLSQGTCLRCSKRRLWFRPVVASFSGTRWKQEPETEGTDDLAYFGY